MLRFVALGCVAFGALLSGPSGAAAAEATAVTEIVYPAPESQRDKRYRDLVELLDGALARTADQGPYRLRPSGIVMNEAREVLSLESGYELDVLWTATSVEKERAMLPVRIPLRKGLLGYRVALIAKDLQPQLDAVQTIDDLRRFRVGQGIGWGDLAIYDANAFTVVTANYDLLFRMVVSKRFDLLPRGVSEVFSEFDALSPEIPDLAVERHLLIEYPLPYYFFFRRTAPALAARVEAGLRAMIADGGFDANFHKYNDEAIRRADLAHRRVIRLENPFLPPETPLKDRSLWFDPTHGR
jgi:ABC-type amino acid transport substrate-binding protein